MDFSKYKNDIYILIIFVFVGSQIYSQKKDTLVFKYDEQYFKTGDYYDQEKKTGEYYINEKSKYKSDAFIFLAKDRYIKFKPKEILNLKEHIRSTKFYDKKYKTINPGLFTKYFENYIVFFAKKKDTNTTIFIKVYPVPIIYN